MKRCKEISIGVLIVLAALAFGILFARGVEKYHGIEGDCSCKWHIIKRMELENWRPK